MVLDVHSFIEIRKLAGLSQASFAAKLGLTRELINKIESERIPITKRTIKRVQSFLEAAPFSQEVKILGKSATDVKKSTQPYFIERRDLKAQPASYQVPLVAIKAQAGYVRGFEQVDFVNTLDQYSLPPGVNPTGAIWRYFEIDGDSMEPSMSSGDVVLATMVPEEDWNDIKNFNVYIILTEDQLLIKRLYRKSEKEWVLISDNEEANPQVLIDAEKVKQLWLFRRHIRTKIPQPKEFKIAV
jgi:phage repressor protein C with HTH and peptisase S24 domain